MNKSELTETISKYIDCFDLLYSSDEDCIVSLFSSYPTNRDITVVKDKIRLLNSKYHTCLFSDEINRLADHIVSNDQLDSWISKGSLQAVEYIGGTPNDMRNAYVFASKYCSFHNNKAFPIYDSLSRLALASVNESFAFADNLETERLVDYEYYKQQMDLLIAKLDFKYSYKELDKYLWLYGKVLKRSNS